MTDLPKVYLARAGKSGQDEELALEKQLAVIGFREVPSLEDARDYDAVLQLVKNTYPDKKARAVGNFAGQLWAFALAMQEGDIVVLPRKLTSQIAIGRVAGPYQHIQVNDSELRHTRPVEWIRTDVPRTAFEQDLLYSFGAFMTVCNISRNDAARRVLAVLEEKPDPGPSILPKIPPKGSPPSEDQTEAIPDLTQMAHDQIVAHIQSRFTGHALTHLVDAVLQIDGWVTKVSPPGPDGCRRSMLNRACSCVGEGTTRSFCRNRSRGTSWCVCGTAAIWWVRYIGLTNVFQPSSRRNYL